MTPDLNIRGFEIYEHFLNPEMQRRLVEELRETVAKTPPFKPILAGGKRMSVKMTSLGRLGWVADQTGYRYTPEHPNGLTWPPIPQLVMDIWKEVSGVVRAPDCCLMNYYGEDTRMGMHQDKDEADFSLPVVSVSLGDDALFRMGNLTRGGKTDSLWLRSGDVVVMGGSARRAFHGIDRIRFGSSPLLPKGGRLNLTLRVVT